jgi:hypothetical protein
MLTRINADPERLKRSHLVITSYNIVASEYASYVPATSKGSSAKGKKKAETDSDTESSDSDSDARFKKIVGVKKKPGPKPRSGTKDALFHLKWWRIVLGVTLFFACLRAVI